MILRQILERAVTRYPENLVVVDGERRYSYAAWDERVNAVANALRGLGVRRSDRVVQVLKNREENCAIHMACQKLGAINTPLNFRWATNEIEFCVNDAEARILVFEDATSESVLSVRDRLGYELQLLCVGQDVPDEAYSFDKAVEAAARTRPDDVVKEYDTALMLYTSGTTGRPKGVLRSQRAEYEAIVTQMVHARYGMGERILGAMPLFHSLGVRSFTTMLALNGLFVAMPDWEIEQALKATEHERITCLHLVPNLFYQMVHDSAFERYDTSSVRKLIYGGAPMPGPLVEACNEKFQPEVFVNLYGSTEASIVSVYSEPWKKPGCSGRAPFNTELRVVRADPEPIVSPEDVVPTGETGEIIVLLSDVAFTSYHNRPGATAKAVRNGWYFTRDTGHLDSDGDLWVSGRVDDMIITGGENVYPVEVERELARHPDVAEVAVVGRPDERWGQVITAFVVPKRADLTESDIDVYCQSSARLTPFKRPKEIVFVKEIPKSPAGKLLRRLLIEGDYTEA